MKKTINRVIGMLAVVATVMCAQTNYATPVPITGVIEISGAATANSANAANVTQITGWSKNKVVADSGTFVSLAHIGDTVTLKSPWTLNTTTPIFSFWTVDGFSFELTSSSETSLGNSAIQILINGIVTRSGYAATDFYGSLTLQDPSIQNGICTWSYSESMSFGTAPKPVSTPDGGTTVLLLGLSFIAMVGIHRYGFKHQV